MTQRCLIGLVGRKGSGKGTFAKILQDRYGAKVYRYSDVLRHILDQLFLEKRRENLVKLSEALRKEFGEGILKQTMITQVKLDPADLIVIDGIRRLEDLDGLEQLGELRLIAIEAPLETRFERLRNRGENAGESTRTFESFIEMENAPTEVTIADVEKKAWNTIQNTGTYEDLIRKIDRVMNELKQQSST